MVPAACMLPPPPPISTSTGTSGCLPAGSFLPSHCFWQGVSDALSPEGTLQPSGHHYICQSIDINFAQTQTEVVECIMVIEVRHGTPAEGKDSLQEYVHQNPIKIGQYHRNQS